MGCDLTPSLCSGDEFLDPIKTGSISIILIFSITFPESVNLIVYMDFESEFSLNRNRKVLKDF